MAQTYDTLTDLLDHGFDDVIDVRSPAEFAEDHIPGAINLPVLSNEERAHVGTIYTRESAFKGRKVGAALVFRNAAAHIEGPLAGHDGKWRPLVYCWRGGQRSGAFGWMLGQIGWRADTVAGGYQTFRRLVYDALYEAPFPCPVVLLDGYTGTAKTEILAHLPALGVQMLDLEGMANHRGSLLGGMGPQPSQKAFETALASAVARLDPARPVLIEAESNKIGARIIPPSVWKAMRAAPRIEVTAPIEARARYLAQAYADVLADPDALLDKLSPLRAHRGAEVLERWQTLARGPDRAALTQSLMQDHYDLSYAKSRRSIGADCVAEVALPALDDASIRDGAARVAGALDQIARSQPASSVT